MNILIRTLLKKTKYIWLIVAVLSIIGVFYIGIVSDFFVKSFYKEKVWVHRVDAIPRLKEVLHNYNGVEVDVVFHENGNYFDVGHPPVISIGLTLQEFISIAIANKSNVKFWIDFKNLTKENAKQSALKLDSIVRNLQYQTSAFIVESHNVKHLSIFDSLNFKISYYLNWPGISTKDKATQKQLLKEIAINDSLYHPDYFSSPYNDYALIRNHFPNKNFLTWIEGARESSSLFLRHFKRWKVVGDKRVKVCLFSVKTTAPKR